MIKTFIGTMNPTGYNHYLRWLPNVTRVTNLSTADLILFPGGEDVHPHLYGHNMNTYTRANPIRDLHETYLFNYAVRNNKKILGICRGSQFVTVMSGGNLLQHVANHGSRHTVYLSNGKVISVISTHHQMMNPYVLDRKDYKLIGVAEQRIDSFVDGDNMVVPLEEDFLEPEIVYYPKTDALAIQGHPERQSADQSQAEYIKAQVDIFETFMNNKMEKYGDYRDK